jgi:hypothetical protein
MNLKEQYKRLFKGRIGSNDKKLLKEFFVKAGDPYQDVEVLNIFSDMLFDEPIDEQPGMEEGVEATVRKYRPIAEKLWKEIEGLKGQRLNARQAEAIDDVMYDGHDLYESPDWFNEEAPDIFDTQIKTLVDVLGLEG